MQIECSLLDRLKSSLFILQWQMKALVFLPRKNSPSVADGLSMVGQSNTSSISSMLVMSVQKLLPLIFLNSFTKRVYPNRNCVDLDLMVQQLCLEIRVVFKYKSDSILLYSSLFVHCHCHRLQLAAVHVANKHQEVQRVLGTLLTIRK